MIECEIIVDINEIWKLKDVWKKLFDSGNFEVSASYEWTESLINTHLTKNHQFSLIVFRNGSKIIGLIPLVCGKRERLGLNILNLHPISELYCTHSDILISEKFKEVINELFNTIFRLNTNWDAFRLNRLSENHSFLYLAEEWLKEKSVAYEIKKEDPSFFIRIEGSYEEYLKGRSKNFRKSLRWANNKLKKIDGMRFKTLNEFNLVSDAHMALLNVERESWKHKHGTAISRIKKQEEFYKILCERTAKRGWLNLQFLYIDDEPVAYNMGMCNKNKYFYLKTSFKEKYRSYFPSMILRANLIKNLFSEGIQELDFTGEPYEWEKRWTKKFKWYCSLVVYNSGLKSKVVSIYNRIKGKKKKKRYKNGLRYYEPKDVKPK